MQKGAGVFPGSFRQSLLAIFRGTNDYQQDKQNEHDSEVLTEKVSAE